MVGKFHVLVVDDDPDKRGMLELALAAEGYEVHTATNVEKHSQLSNRFHRIW